MNERNGVPPSPMSEQAWQDISDRELAIRREMQTCKHFCGTRESTCRVGVNYRQLVGGPDLGWGTRLPCLAAFEPKNGAIPTCEQKQCWTREEAETNETKHEAALVKFSLAHRAAKDDAKAKGFKRNHGGNSQLKCPICPDGTLRYSVASYNGHMHASCSTEGCVSWME